MKLAFSNLAAPGWSLERCCEAVREYGYDGLELRLYDAEPIDVLAPPELPVDVPVCCLDTSIQLAGDFERELPAAIELARRLGAPTVRVFGGDVGSLDDVARRLSPLLVSDVTVALSETHDAFSSAARVAELLRLVDAPGFAALWDVCHTWRAGESPAEARELLGDRIALVHVKDARRDGKLALLGDGDVPWAESLAGYDGWVSVEWEKRWHPELAEPELALPQHLKLLR